LKVVLAHCASTTFNPIFSLSSQYNRPQIYKNILKTNVK